MTGRVVFLGLLLICVAADAGEKSGFVRKQPTCPDNKEIVACPLNFAPVCGSDGNTYANECLLCLGRQQAKRDILIVKEGNC